MRRTHLKAKENLKFTVNTAHFNILGNFVLILTKASGIGYMHGTTINHNANLFCIN